MSLKPIAYGWLISAGLLIPHAAFADDGCHSPDQIAQKRIVQTAYQAQTLKPIFLSRSLNTLLKKDQRCAQAQGGICHLDFEPLYDSQDPDVRRVDYRCTRERVVATLFGSSSKPQTIGFSFVREKGSWKVDDVHYAETPSLKKMLSQ